MTENPAILREAKEGRALFFLQFGGQGGPWLSELARYYSDPRFRRFFDTAIGAVEEEWPRIRDGIGYHLGFDVRRWLAEPASAPAEEYLDGAAISMAMIQMTQLAHYEFLMQSGFDDSVFQGRIVGASGHSQGLISASFASLQLAGDAYYEALAKFMKYTLYLGHRAQQAFPHLEPTEEEIALSAEVEGDPPSPMAAVVGGTHETISAMVDEMNRELPEDRKIYVSLYNTPRNRILSSYRRSLVEFHRRHHRFFEELKIQFVYLKTTCPFHSPYMDAVREPFEGDLKHLDFHVAGSRLRYPVVSFFDGRNLQNDADISPLMYRDMAINPLHWERALGPVREAQVTHILDFGPGKTTQRLSNETLAGWGMNLPVYALAMAKDQKKILTV